MSEVATCPTCKGERVVDGERSCPTCRGSGVVWRDPHQQESVEQPSADEALDLTYRKD